MVAREKILVVDDEQDILELLKFNLQKEGYQVITSTSGEIALTMARTQRPSLLILDLLLPEMDGLEVCRALKRDPATQHIPIIILSAKSEDADLIIGLELGADDYVTKPFSPRVLIARVRKIIHRKKETADNNAVIDVHELTIHPGRHEVLAGGRVIDLTDTEFRMLYFLARRPGWVFSRYDIVNGVRGEEAIVTDRSVDVQVVGLRKKLGDAGKYIETVRGVGYRFKE